MNAEVDREPTVENPTLVAKVQNQLQKWNKELKDPWAPSLQAKRLIQSMENSSPTMTAALRKAGILEPWAEMILDQVWEAFSANADSGMEAHEAMSQARMELLPLTEKKEAEWLAAHADL